MYFYSFPCCDDGTEILEEVLRREKEAGIRPDHDVDTYMKVRIFNLSKSSIFIAFLTVENEQGLDSHILSYWLYDILLGCQCGILHSYCGIVALLPPGHSSAGSCR